MKDMRWKLAALAAAVLVAACGGESADGPSNKVGINAMVSFGDSLSDIGSYNVGSIAGLGAATGGAGRFTVNATTGGQIWTERIAALLPAATPCPAQTGLSPSPQLGLTGAPFTAKPGCTQYAQGGARVSSPAGLKSGLPPSWLIRSASHIMCSSSSRACCSNSSFTDSLAMPVAVS